MMCRADARHRQFSGAIAIHVCDRQHTCLRVACEKSYIALTAAHDERTGRTACQRVWIASSANSIVCINFDPEHVDGITPNSLGFWHVC